MSRENVEVVRRTLETFAREGTAGSFAGLLADDFELRPAFEVAGGESFVGADRFGRFMQQWTENFDDWDFEVDERPRRRSSASRAAAGAQSAANRSGGTRS